MVSDRVYLTTIIFKFTFKNRIIFFSFLVDAIDESEDNVISHETVDVRQWLKIS